MDGNATPLVTLAQFVNAVATTNSSATALVIDNKNYSYQELAQAAKQIASWLQKNAIQRVGIFAARSLMAYASVLAAQWLGICYVPLNPAFPVLRLKAIKDKAQFDALIVDELHATLVTTTEYTFFSALPTLTPDTLTTFALLQTAPTAPNSTDLTYIIFTSGTTGEPKGVPISYGNLAHFFNVVSQRYKLSANDRISQFSALTFDVSLFDMCLAWHTGAALYVIPEKELLAPADFIIKHALTVFLAVPTIIHFMEKLQLLKPNIFPTLKYSLFTGEKLTLPHAELWQQAAPQSQLENLYGPTEATVDCMVQPFIKDLCLLDNVPIGKALPGMFSALVNHDLAFLSGGEKGELAIAGPQVISGYWRENSESQKKFVTLHHPEYGTHLWYLTGDYCYQNMDGVFYYLHRMDKQNKILGQRVELGEIEFYLRKLTKNNQVAAFILHIEAATEPEVIALINVPNLDLAALKTELHKYLPTYMLPSRIIYLAHFPHTAHHKIDREALTQMLMTKFNSGIE